jgi:hypothetical protein
MTVADRKILHRDLQDLLGLADRPIGIAFLSDIPTGIRAPTVRSRPPPPRAAQELQRPDAYSGLTLSRACSRSWPKTTAIAASAA